MFAIIVGTMMLPGIVTTFRIYIMSARMGLTDTSIPRLLLSSENTTPAAPILPRGSGAAARRSQPTMP